MGGHGAKMVQGFVWDVCHTPCWSNGYHFENKTDKRLRLLLEEPTKTKELLLFPKDVKLIFLQSSSIMLSAAFWEREYTSWKDIAHNAASGDDDDDAPPPEHAYYVFKRRRKMDAGTDFTALQRHWDELKDPRATIEHVDSLRAALAAFDENMKKPNSIIELTKSDLKMKKLSPNIAQTKSVAASPLPIVESNIAKLAVSKSEAGRKELPSSDIKSSLRLQSSPKPISGPTDAPAISRSLQGEPKRDVRDKSATRVQGMARADKKDKSMPKNNSTCNSTAACTKDVTGETKSQGAFWGPPELGSSFQFAGSAAPAAPIEMPAIWAKKYGIPYLSVSSPIFPHWTDMSDHMVMPTWGVPPIESRYYEPSSP